MRPIANVMTGYIIEEPNDFWHGKLIRCKLTFFLRVFYPMTKEGWTKSPAETGAMTNKSRKFPFIIHPNALEQVMARKPWKGQFVTVTYYVDVVEKSSRGYAVMLLATRIERMLDDFPEAKVNDNVIWMDSNAIEEEIGDVEI